MSSSRQVVAVLAVAVAVLAGCAKADQGTGTAPTAGSSGSPAGSAAPGDIASFTPVEPGSGKGLKIGYISYGETVPTVNIATKSIREQVERAGAELVFCDAQLKADKALQCAQNLKTQQVDAVLNYQPDAKASAAVCAALPKVPVIAISVPQEPCAVSFMGVDNKAAGLLTGRALGVYFKTTFNCEYDAYVSLEASASGQVTRDRMDGIQQGFEESCGPVKNKKAQDANQVDTGRTVFADILTSLPNAKRIVVAGVQDAPLLGAIAAATAAGRVDQIYLGGQAADQSAWCAIKNNPNWIADTAYFPEHFGEIAVPAAIKAVKGGQLPPKMLIPVEVVNAKNIAEHYDVSKC